VTPVLCAAGSYSNSSASSCSPCLAGYACGTQGTTFSGMLGAVCLAGTFSAAGASSCSQCAAGSYSGGGAAMCTPCPAGSFCTAGSTAPTLCRVGFYSNASAPACVGCPTGTYCPNQGTTLAGLQTCPSGTYCPFNAVTGTPNATHCADGNFSGWAPLSASVAFALPYNSSDPTRMPVPAPTGAACSPCPDGYACSAPVGSGNAVTQAAPALCPGPDAGEGSVTYHVNTFDSKPCTLCTPGKYCTLPNVLAVRI
jgi:hypothetical protein